MCRVASCFSAHCRHWVWDLRGAGYRLSRRSLPQHGAETGQHRCRWCQPAPWSRTVKQVSVAKSPLVAAPSVITSAQASARARFTPAASRCRCRRFRIIVNVRVGPTVAPCQPSSIELLCRFAKRRETRGRGPAFRGPFTELFNRAHRLRPFLRFIRRRSSSGPVKKRAGRG